MFEEYGKQYPSFFSRKSSQFSTFSPRKRKNPFERNSICSFRKSTLVLWATNPKEITPYLFWESRHTHTHTAITRNLLRNLTTTTPNPSFSPSTSRLVNFCASHAACHLLSLPFSHRPVFRHPNLTVASLLTHTWDWGESARFDK